MANAEGAMSPRGKNVEVNPTPIPEKFAQISQLERLCDYSNITI